MVQGYFRLIRFDLLKFSIYPFDGLLRALDERFSSLTRADADISMRLVGNPDGPHPQEYLADASSYGMLAHTALFAPMGEDEARATFKRRVVLSVRMFIEDLQTAEKIFVYKSIEPLTRQDVSALHSRLSTYGPVTLLWVRLAEPGYPVGHTEWLDDRLMCGRMSRFAPYDDADSYDLDAWIKCCSAAYVLYRS
jgi:hypothetical protein